jgi:hypothetical protein
VVTGHGRFDARRRAASFAQAQDVHYLLSTHGVPADARCRLEEAGMQIVTSGETAP